MTLDIDAIEREVKAFPLRPDPEDLHRLIAEVRHLRTAVASLEQQVVDLEAALICESDDAEGALEWIASGVLYARGAAGKFAGYMNGEQLVELARAVVQSRREEGE